MAAFDSHQEDRTEPASHFRREEFRRQGRVALSREVLSVSLLFLVGLAVYFSGSHVFHEVSEILVQFFRFEKLPVEKNELVVMGRNVAQNWAWAMSPVFVVAILTAIIVGALQVGVHFSWEPLMPHWERLDPIRGLQRLVSLRGFLEAAKGLFKLAVGGWLLYLFAKQLTSIAGGLFARDLTEGILLSFSLVGKLFLWLVLAFGVLALLDFAFQKWQLEKEMRMTRRELKDEFKLREGDPLIKARIRNIQRRIASRRMMEQVPKADVVVTNPTHFSIALLYDETMIAPKVIAKGAGYVALKIRSIALKAGVPLVENKPLARTLYKEVEVGGYVPRELYKAVAQVLSYVYRLRKSGYGARLGESVA